MQLVPELVPPAAPFLPFNTDWGEDDVRTWRIVSDNLRGMNRSAIRFSDGLALRRLSEQEDAALRAADRATDPFRGNAANSAVWRRWIFIGAEAAALACHDFRNSLEQVHTFCVKIEEWRDLVDLAAVKEGRRRLQALFPNIGLVRHTIAHKEHFQNPDKPWAITSGEAGPKVGGRPMIKTEGAEIRLGGGLWEDTYCATIDGRTAEFEFNEVSATALSAITADVFRAFDKISSIPVDQQPPGLGAY